MFGAGGRSRPEVRLDASPKMGIEVVTYGVAGELPMPIYALLREQAAFTPDEVTVLGNVFEDVLRTLGLVDRNDPLTEMVAKKVVELAKAGIREPDRLKAVTIQAFVRRQLQTGPKRAL
jgi:hypothetical protein